jgi:hypothetical protein
MALTYLTATVTKVIAVLVSEHLYQASTCNCIIMVSRLCKAKKQTDPQIFRKKNWLVTVSRSALEYRS